NARFGDPETQVVLPRLLSPFGRLLHAAATGRLADLPPLRWSEDAAVTVVVASEGYPGTVRSGDEITGIADAEAIDGVHVLHAGTAITRRPAGDDDSALRGAGSSRRAAAYCPWWASVRTSLRRAPRRTRVSRRSSSRARTIAATSRSRRASRA